MRAIRLKKPGGLDKLELLELDMVEPQCGEIRITNHASSLKGKLATPSAPSPLGWSPVASVLASPAPLSSRPPPEYGAHNKAPPSSRHGPLARPR